MSFPYRASHVGSLLRPADLLAARRDPRTSPETLRALEDRHIQRILARQQDLGFRLFTDGELRRRTFMSELFAATSGWDARHGVERAWSGGAGAGAGARAGAGDAPAPRGSGVIRERLRALRRIALHESEFLLRHAPGDVKVTLPSANQLPAIAYRRDISQAAYPTYSDFLWDLVPVIREEIRLLCEEGVRCIQLDAPRYSYFVDPRWRAHVEREMGKSPEDALDEAIRVDNACLEGARGRAGVTLVAHICRGNNRSRWYAEGGYDAIAGRLFRDLSVDVLSLEYDSARCGSFEPLRHVPADRVVCLGLVSTKTPALESRDEVRRRLDEAARHVPLERLALSPQCGFASVEEGNLLDEEAQWAKLALVAEVAREVWG